MKAPFIIRKAKESDAADIYNLITDLAVYEKEPDAVNISVDTLIQDGFRENPKFNCFIAINEKKDAIGFALFYDRYSTWNGKSLYLEDLYVKTEYRGKNVGKALFEKVLEYAQDHDYSQYYWQVLNWNEMAINFYKKYPTQFSNEWTNCYIKLDKSE